MMVLEMKIIKQELQFEECLKQRLEFICEFSKVTPTFINGSIRVYGNVVTLKVSKHEKKTYVSIRIRNVILLEYVILN